MLLFISGLMTREIGFVNVKTISGNRKNNELFNWVGVELTNVTIPATIDTYLHTYLPGSRNNQTFSYPNGFNNNTISR